MEIDFERQIHIDIPIDRLSDIEYQSLEKLLWNIEVKNLVERVRSLLYTQPNPYDFVDEAEKLYLQALELCNEKTGKIFLLIEINRNLYYQCRNSVKIFANCNLINALLDSIEGNSNIKSVLRIYCLSQISLASELIGDITTMKMVNEKVIECINGIPNLNPRFRSVAMNNLGTAYAYLGINNDSLFQELIDLRIKTGTGSELFTATRTKINYLNSIGEFNETILLADKILLDPTNQLSELALWSIEGAKAIAYAGKAESDFGFHEIAIDHLDIVLGKFPNNRDNDTLQFKGRLFHALAKISEPEDAIRICKQNQLLYKELGDKYHEGLAYLLEAQIYLKQGNKEEAQISYIEAYKCFDSGLPENSPYFRAVIEGISKLRCCSYENAIKWLKDQKQVYYGEKSVGIARQCVELKDMHLSDTGVYSHVLKTLKEYWGINGIRISIKGLNIYREGNCDFDKLSERVNESHETLFTNRSIKYRNYFWLDRAGEEALTSGIVYEENDILIELYKSANPHILETEEVVSLSNFLHFLCLFIAKNSLAIDSAITVMRKIFQTNRIVNSSLEEPLIRILTDPLEDEIVQYKALQRLSTALGDRQTRSLLLKKRNDCLDREDYFVAQRFDIALSKLGFEDEEEVAAHMEQGLKRKFNTADYPLTQAFNRADRMAFQKISESIRFMSGLILFLGGGSGRSVMLFDEILKDPERQYLLTDFCDGALATGKLIMSNTSLQERLKVLSIYYQPDKALTIAKAIEGINKEDLGRRTIFGQANFKSNPRKFGNDISHLLDGVNDPIVATFATMRTSMYAQSEVEIGQLHRNINSVLHIGGYYGTNHINPFVEVHEDGSFDLYNLCAKLYRERARRLGLPIDSGFFRDEFNQRDFARYPRRALSKKEYELRALVEGFILVPECMPFDVRVQFHEDPSLDLELSREFVATSTLRQNLIDAGLTNEADEIMQRGVSIYDTYFMFKKVTDLS